MKEIAGGSEVVEERVQGGGIRRSLSGPGLPSPCFVFLGRTLFLSPGFYLFVGPLA